MTINGSTIPIIPKQFSGLRVLLIEPEESKLQHHAYILTQNSYRVTSTTKAFMGLSMIMKGDTFDGVLIDADICDMDMMAFVKPVLKHQPELSLIMMAFEDIHLRVTQETLEHEAVMCLLKPCSLRDICDIWKHICRNRIDAFEDVLMWSAGNYTTRAAGVEDDQGRSSGSSAADKGKQEADGDGKYYYKESRRKEMIIGDTSRIIWKGALHERFLDTINELGDKANSSSILWHMNVRGLTRFHVASHLQKHKLKQKKKKKPRGIYKYLHRRFGYSTPPRSNNNNNNNNNNDVPSIQSTTSSHLLRPSPSPMLNSVGNSYMSIDNIAAKLQAAGVVLPHNNELISTSTTPIINNSSTNGSDQNTTDYSLGLFEDFNQGGHDVLQMTGGEISTQYHAFQEVALTAPNAGSSSTSSLQGLMDAVFNEFDDYCNYSSWDAAAAGSSSEAGQKVALDCFGINATAVPSWDVVGDSNAAAIISHDDGPQSLLIPELLVPESCEVQGGILTNSQEDFHVNGENLTTSMMSAISAGVGHDELPVNTNQLSEIDLVLPFGVLSINDTDFSLTPTFSAGENNNTTATLAHEIQPADTDFSLTPTFSAGEIDNMTTTLAHEIQPAAAWDSSNIAVPYSEDGSECMVTDDDRLFLNMSQSDLEMTMDYLIYDHDGHVTD